MSNSSRKEAIELTDRTDSNEQDSTDELPVLRGADRDPLNTANDSTAELPVSDSDALDWLLSIARSLDRRLERIERMVERIESEYSADERRPGPGSAIRRLFGRTNGA